MDGDRGVKFAAFPRAENWPRAAGAGSHSNARAPPFARAVADGPYLSRYAELGDATMFGGAARELRNLQRV
eukprot:11195349-Lingulodinium_polyedra.AAC.1